MVAGVETSVGFLRFRLLGPLEIHGNGKKATLPASRKVRGLLAYLTLAPRAVTRSALCELLWDSPSDPRGELRWSLSKVRGLVGEKRDGSRVVADGDSVRLELAGCAVDALEVARAMEAGVESLGAAEQRRLEALFAGDFLEGLGIERSPAFEAWLTAQRRRFRACHAALLEQLAKRVSDGEALGYLEKWRQLAPFDKRVHEALLELLARTGRMREGEEHLAITVKLFEAEGLDPRPIRDVWVSRRNQTSIEIEAQASPAQPARRASIAVMPFADRSGVVVRGGIGDALSADVITRLAKLRVLFVIGHGSVFALHDRGVGAEEAGRMLDVDYVVSGGVRSRGGRLVVTAELCETRSARVAWADSYNVKQDDAFAVLEDIGNRIVASVAAEIETIERNRAVLKPPSSLDAWEACHRGFWHMYRYQKVDNDHARRFFEIALQLDPTFSRAYAGLSFTHFQDAFQGWEPRDPSMELAYKSATQGLTADERDPAAYWALGRAYYLRQRFDESEQAIKRSVELSPNFALGHYNLSFVRSLYGDPRVAISDADHSRALSPFDPMLFGMLATRAMSLVRLGDYEQAAQWAVKAAERPNSFPHIHALAACSLALAGSMEQARAYAATAVRIDPRYNLAKFLETFRFEPEGAARFREGARLVGMA